MPLGAARFGLLGGVADLGKLELIHTENASAVSYVDFLESAGTFDTSYNVHFLTINNIHSAQDNGYLGLQFYESGTLETANVYQYAKQYGLSTGTFGEFKTTTINQIQISHAHGNATNESGGLYAYIYNAGDSSKYTFATCHSSSVNGATQYGFEFGSGVLPQANTVDGIRIIENNRSGAGNANISGTASLYGIAES